MEGRGSYRDGAAKGEGAEEGQYGVDMESLEMVAVRKGSRGDI